MSTTIINYTIPAAGVTPNLFENTNLQYFSAAAVLTLYGACDAAGDTMDFHGFPGSRAPEQYVVAGSPMPVATAAGQIRTNENYVAQVPIPAKTRLGLVVTGTAGHTGRFQIVVD